MNTDTETMRQKLKKYFIPHKANDHKPHILRAKSVGVMAVLILLVEIVFLFQATIVLRQARFFALIFPNVVTDTTNVARADNALSPLTVNPLLEAAAQLKANDMATKSYFAHTSLEGISPWYWFGQVAYSYTHAGENLAVNFSDSKDVVDAWMQSPGHRANILNTEFTEIGIATAEGTYKGQKAVFVVQLFGKPARAPFGAAPLAQAEEVPPQTLPTQPPPAQTPPIQNTPPPSPKQEMYVTLDTGSDGAPLAAVDVSDVPEPTTDAEVTTESNAAERVLANPRTVSNYFYVFLSLFVLVALALKIFIKMRIQHPMLIANGVFLLMMIVGAVYFNEYVALHEALIF